MLKKISGILILSLVLFSRAFAQDDSSYVRDEKKEPLKDFRSSRDQKEIIPWEDKFFVGFYPGLQFSSYGTLLEFSPLVGYKVLPRLYVGAGGIYRYFNIRNYGGPNTSSNSYGARAFAFFDIFKGFVVYGEYEGLSTQYFDQNYNLVRQWQTAVKAGGGYKAQIGQRSFINILLLYNLSYDKYTSLVSNPLEYRAGFVFFPFKSKLQ